MQKLSSQSSRTFRKNEPINPIAAIAENAIIGYGISSSASMGPTAYVKRPKRLQIPNAVPQTRSGKTQGVDT